MADRTRRTVHQAESDIEYRIAEHIGSRLCEDGHYVCPACESCAFGPTMSLDQLAVYELGYLPGAPLLAGACLDCGHVTEPKPREES